LKFLCRFSSDPSRERRTDAKWSLLRSGYRMDHSRTTSHLFANQFQAWGRGKREISPVTSHVTANVKLAHLVRVGYENWSVSPRLVSIELTFLRRNWNCIFNDRKREWRAKWRRVTPSIVDSERQRRLCSLWDGILSYLPQDIICRN